jgi:predicted nucleic acid-binding OB-fold protein
MTLYKSTEFYTEWFNVCPNITSKSHTIATPKSFVKQIMIQLKLVRMSANFNCTEFHLSKW